VQRVREGKTGMFMTLALKLEKMLIANCTIGNYLKFKSSYKSRNFLFLRKTIVK